MFSKKKLLLLVSLFAVFILSYFVFLKPIKKVRDRVKNKDYITFYINKKYKNSTLTKDESNLFNSFLITNKKCLSSLKTKEEVSKVYSFIKDYIEKNNNLDKILINKKELLEKLNLKEDIFLDIKKCNKNSFKSLNLDSKSKKIFKSLNKKLNHKQRLKLYNSF